MSQINNSTATNFTPQGPSGPSGAGSDPFNQLDIDSFLTLLISELQNQDPLDPVDNSDTLQQIGQIREIGATDQLTRTLSSLSSNQELVTASGLIGRTIDGLDVDGAPVSGEVDRITVDTDSENETRSIKVHVGERTIDLRNVREVTTG